jgi:hypothetical protein
MKRQFLILMAIAALATAWPTDAFGQTGKTVKANVKFDFEIGARTYPAGEYRIESISTENVLLITSVADVNNKQIILAGYSNRNKRQTPKLVFQKYGASYVLTQVFFDSGEWGYSIHPWRRQRESETTLASRLPRGN